MNRPSEATLTDLVAWFSQTTPGAESVAEITGNYLRETGMALVEFAAALDKWPSIIDEWRAGTTRPSRDDLLTLVALHNDWRFDFAVACLSSSDKLE
jgi:hypothetical protein